MYPADITGVAGAALGIIAIVLVAYIVAFGLSIMLYVLQSLGLYTIAQRRGIKHPWLAWLPLVNMWILGSISDQYRYVVRGQIRNRRKALLFLYVLMFVLGITVIGGYVAVLVDLILQIPDLTYVMTGNYFGAGVIPGLWVFGVIAAIWILALVAVVFQYVCLYDLYASCSPNYRVLFLVLSILFHVTMPFFVFACRKMDLGMPPRRQVSTPEQFDNGM